jgi:hypothetical protein
MSRCRFVVTVFVGILGLLIATCSSNKSGTDGDDNSTGDPTILVGTFKVSLVAEDTATATPAYTDISGKIYDGPTTSLSAVTIWEQVAGDGDCKLLKPRVPFCSDGCGSSAACVEDGVCQSYPTVQTVGTVTLKGLKTSSGATEFSIEPINKTYVTAETFEYPPCSEGDEISFSASGSSFTPAFSISAKGIIPLMVHNDSILIGDGQALNLTWSPSGQSGISKIIVKLDISHHGGIKGMIECDNEDTGLLVLSASLLGKLIELGVAGFPTIVITRSAVGSKTISAGRVDLVVSSAVTKAVKISGYTSCNKNEDCPSEKPSCNQDKLLCE